ncbi:MAG: hypothetical protein EDM03_02785 [Porphyrobacter sp. IPPAS B-1204]|nr:MAG: hypothetical protein EDM03_02785 [Porphyrobacter sp. IPPAS B-1204]
MTLLPHTHRPATSRPAWLATALAGVVVPAVAIGLLADAPPGLVAGPILATGLMGAGMIGAAAAGRLWIGVALALLTGAGLVLSGRMAGLLPPAHLLPAAFAMLVASVSFAARGALFARSMADKGWWIAVAVVAGEAAIIATAAARPGDLPEWLLVLLPAQWASAAIRAALGGASTLAAGAPLLALAGTAAATLLVARLWPSRWPYLVMFTTWLALSALVWHNPAP